MQTMRVLAVDVTRGDTDDRGALCHVIDAFATPNGQLKALLAP